MPSAHHATRPHPPPQAYHAGSHRAELLLLFRGEQCGHFLHQGDVGQAQVSLFHGYALEQLLGFRKVHRVRIQHLLEINGHDTDIRSKAYGLLGMMAQEHPYLGLLVVSELELLR
jgi:hypothetical protein